MSIFTTGARPALACAALFFTPIAFAHVTLETPQAAIGTSYKAVLRVPHGCQGAATTGLRVRVPEGVIGVKPQPKPGWKLKTTSGNYDKPHTLYGSAVTSGVREIDWSGGSLADGFYDEFVFVGYLSDNLKPGATLYFPVVQECEHGVARWIDLPDANVKTSGDHHAGTPAPGLKLLPRAPR